MDHEVTSDGRTVWVNNVICCIGRFGRGGIDIHKSLDAQIAGEGECLYCTHEQPTAEDWVTFQQKMKELHNVEVGDKHRPKWLPSSEVDPKPLRLLDQAIGDYVFIPGKNKKDIRVQNVHLTEDGKPEGWEQ